MKQSLWLRMEEGRVAGGCQEHSSGGLERAGKGLSPGLHEEPAPPTHSPRPSEAELGLLAPRTVESDLVMLSLW